MMESRNSEVIEALAYRVRNLAESLCTPAPEGEAGEERRRKILGRKLEDAFRDLTPLAEQAILKGLLNSIKDAETLAHLIESLRDAVMDYQTGLQQDIHAKNCQTNEAVNRSLLNGMYHVADAGYRSGNRQGCLKGTREDVVYQIESWSMDEKEKQIFWLNGLAGTGKTAIAQTFAEINSAEGKLGASFFCSRDFEARSNLQAIFPTLAFQLAYRYPMFREQLLEVLRANPDVGRESPRSQLEQVIVHPLKATEISTLIIIDALDECRDAEPVSALLSALSRYVHEIPRVKFLITSRPEPPICNGFRLKSLLPVTVTFRLHEVRYSSVDEDIKLYLRIQLATIRDARSECEFPEEWPSPRDVDILCRKAAVFFLYASKLVKFIAYKFDHPTKRLALLANSQSTAHEREMDLFYTEILERAFRDVDSDDRESYSRFRTTVGTNLLTFNSLSGKALWDLLGRNIGESSHIPIIFRTLGSLFLVPQDGDEPIRCFHKSFPDFLTDRRRCEDDRFFVDPSIHHENILFSCLDLMGRRLKKNICDLDDYAILSEVEDISALKKTCIGDSLEYACGFWTKHLASIPSNGPHVGRIQEAIEEFFAKQLLRWVEVLSITGNLGAAVYAINDIRQWLISAGAQACGQADDSERFILAHFDVIRDSPSHIYHTALTLSPSTSWLRDCYKDEIGQGVRVLMGLPENWDAYSRTVFVEGRPSAFACWGSIIAAGTESGNIIFLDSITGSMNAVLQHHTDVVSSLAFSLDGWLLFSGGDGGYFALWDVQTGGIITSGHYTSAITSVSFSPDNITVAFGARDGTIRLWNVQAEEYSSYIMRHNNEVTAIGFSPAKPQHLVSSSTDRTVRQWDVGGRVEIRVYDEAAAVTHVVCTSDGAQFASCGGAVATLRDSETGAVVKTLGAPDQEVQFRCCCVSPDGRFVACAAGAAIYIWDITDSEARLVGNLVGHSQRIISIAFLPSLISVSEDGYMKFWPVSSFLAGSGKISHTPASPRLTQIRSINLFPDEGVSVTSDSSGAVKIWDLAMGTCKSSFQTPARGIQDTHLTDGTLIVIWWEPGEKNYHIWDVNKGQPVRMVDSCLGELLELRVSGDGSKILGRDSFRIESRSIQTGEAAGLVRYWGGDGKGGLVVDGSKVWFAGSKDKGWDFGGRKVSPFSLTKESSSQLQLRFVDRDTRHRTHPASVQDVTTGRDVFYVPEKYTAPDVVGRWDGRRLVFYFCSGEVVIIDFERTRAQ